MGSQILKPMVDYSTNMVSPPSGSNRAACLRDLGSSSKFCELFCPFVSFYFFVEIQLIYNIVLVSGPSSQGYGFSSSHIWMWELDHKGGWVPKNWCFQTVMLEKTLENPLDYKEIQPVHPIGNQSWIFIGRTDVEAETPIFWPLDAKNWLSGKDPDAGEDWRQEEKGMTEDEMVGWHHWLNGYGFG